MPSLQFAVTGFSAFSLKFEDVRLSLVVSKPALQTAVMHRVRVLSLPVSLT